MAEKSEEPDKSEPPSPKRDGWIDSLAKRSAGLGDDRPAKGPSQDELSESSRLWKLGGLGLQMGVSTVLFWWIGRELDRYFGWQYVGQLSLTMVALIGNMYLLIKDANKWNK